MATAPPLLRSFCDGVLPLLHRHVSAREMLSSVEAVLQTDRWVSFDRFRETTGTIVARYEKAGAVTEVYPVPTGGRIGSGRWVIPEAENVAAATVDVTAPVRRRIADYRKNPAHFIGWSGATSPSGMVGELAVIDSKDELDGLPAGALRGKMLLTRLGARGLLVALSDACASGVLSDMPVPGSPDAVAWQRLGWGGLSLQDASRRTVALSISANAGKALRALLKKHGSVRLRTVVDVRHCAGTHDAVSGIVRGRDRPEEEVWAVAHTMEVGAFDNASGAAVCLEIARVLEKLIAANHIRRPRRSIRLVTAFECYGFFRYYEDAPRGSAPLAGVVLDAVGASPAVCGGRLVWVRTVPMSGGFVNDVGEALIRRALRLDNPGYRLSVSPFLPSADNLLGDPQFGFPCPWLSNCYRPGGKLYHAWHSSADTLALLSPRGLALSAAAMAGYLYYLADASADQVAELASAVTRRALRGLADGRKDLTPAEAARLAEQTHVCLAALKRWVEDRDLLRQMDRWESEVRRAARPRERAGGRRSRRGVQGAGRVARRTAPITPSPDNMPPDLANPLKGIKLPAWALYAADGRRTVADIAARISLETKEEVSAETVLRFLEIHEKLGYVEWVK